jgi:molybdopterin-guanine dinucleotide biosynthesis protein A
MGGGDKCLMPLKGRPILQHILERAAPQVGPLVLNANGDPARFGAFGLPVAADVVDGFAGPLAGVLTGMDWAAANAPGTEWLASFACDAPFLPTDLVARLVAAVEADAAQMACAASGGRRHPVFGLWPLSLRQALRRALVEEGIRKVDRWTSRYRLVEVDFSSGAAGGGVPDPFFNTNRSEDLDAAEAYLGG